MREKVLNNIKEYKMIEEGDTVVVGVSGGHDSMSLLYILYDLKKDINFDLIVAHVNHGVRGELAKRDQEFVRQEAEKLGLDYYYTQVDMNQYGLDHKISSEEAGRILRYGFFEKILEKEAPKSKGKIAVGHNRNDQAETLLMRIMRGTGMDGLRGIDFKNKNIIRPILNIKREEIEDYIDDNNIKTVIDHTNLENIYTRNKIRLDLIPYMEKNFNPNLVDALWRLSEIAGSEVDFLEKSTNEFYGDLVIKESKDSIVIDIEGLKKVHHTMTNRIIRLAIEKIVGNLQGFGDVHIQSILDLISDEDTGKKIDLPNEIVAYRDYGNLIIARGLDLKGENFTYNLKVGSNNLEQLGLNIELSIISIEDFTDIGYNKHISYFDYDRIQGQVKIRNRRPGDKFNPLGMKGSKKIKDFFMDEKISKMDRDTMPMLVDEKDILWILGYRTSGKHRLRKDTKNVLVAKYKLLD